MFETDFSFLQQDSLTCEHVSHCLMIGYYSPERFSLQGIARGFIQAPLCQTNGG